MRKDALRPAHEGAQPGGHPTSVFEAGNPRAVPFILKAFARLVQTKGLLLLLYGCLWLHLEYLHLKSKGQPQWSKG